jgi:hypothetical protein
MTAEDYQFHSSGSAAIQAQPTATRQHSCAEDAGSAHSLSKIHRPLAKLEFPIGI